MADTKWAWEAILACNTISTLQVTALHRITTWQSPLSLSMSSAGIQKRTRPAAQIDVAYLDTLLIIGKSTRSRPPVARRRAQGAKTMSVTLPE
jgi:hypothetical protein